MARPHLEALVRQTGESSSMAQLDGSDIVYVARVAVPKIIALRVDIGTRFPAERTSQGKVLLAALTEAEVARVAGRAVAVRAAAVHRSGPSKDLQRELTRVRAQGWALADEELAPGVRSVAAPVRDGSGRVRAAMNVTVHAAETSTEHLLGAHLPRLLETGEPDQRRLGRLGRPPARRAGPRRLTLNGPPRGATLRRSARRRTRPSTSCSPRPAARRGHAIGSRTSRRCRRR